jgi:SAM-dependent MidA family methyltransferase
VKAQNDYLKSLSVLETLLDMIRDDKTAQDVGFYYRQAHLGEPGDWAGADLVSDWFRRNLRICRNVVQLVESPNERVLVIFGAGHLGWLRHDFESDPSIRLRKLAEFAK